MFHTALVALKECGETGAIIHDKGATLGPLGGSAVSQSHEELKNGTAAERAGSHHTACSPIPVLWGTQAHLPLRGLAQHLKLDACHRENPEGFCPGWV